MSGSRLVKQLARVLREPEWLVLLPFLAVMLGGLACGLPLSLPDRIGLGFVEQHYFRPLLAAAALQALALLVRVKQRQRQGPQLRALSKMLVLIFAAVLIHFNFKAWMPLVHPRLFDVQLSVTDSVLAPVVTGCIALRRWLAAVAGHVNWDLDPLYHTLFVGMFFASFSAHALFDSERSLRRLLLAVCLVLLIGGLSYWILPAEGPFIYRRSESHMADDAQQAMLQHFDQLRATGVIPVGYFASPLAAMPSLHTAHATLFTLFAWRRLRPLCWVMLPVLGWILIEAVASGWHYVIDLPAGAALAWLSLYLATRLVPDDAAGAAPSAKLSPQS